MKELFCAVVLTMNKKNVVLECVKSLLKQDLKKIIVIDNGSVDGTKEFLESKFKSEVLSNKINIIYLEKNIGSAGGYHRGISEAIKSKIDWIWLFDDDCEALEGSLENLKKAKKILEKDGVKIGFLTSISHLLDCGFMRVGIRNKGDQYIQYLKDSMMELKWSVYTGMLVSSDTVKKFGLPRKEMFLYEDDTDFTYRLCKDSYRGFLVGNSEILHKDYFHKRKSFTSKDRALMHRQKYAIRNGVFFSKVLFKESKVDAIFHFMGIFKNMFLGVLFSRNSMYSPILLLYCIKGLFFNPKIEKYNNKI